MKSLGLIKHAFCYCTLGLLCGWYFVLLFAFPILLFFSFRGSVVSILILTALFVLSVAPIKFEPWEYFMYSWIFKWWTEYFDLTYDNSTIVGENALKKGSKYIFFEFPHGIFPMGQFLSASLIKDLTPGHMICGTGADIIFKFPVMRQIMSWLGTHPASRKNISTIFRKGYQCAIIPGGIAEMYLVDKKAEKIFFLQRRNTVKVAIQEGASIVVLFSFGNTRLFEVSGGDNSKSWLSSISRKFRASIVFFWPFPKRHPIKLVTGDVVPVQQNDNPTEEQIDEVMAKVVASIEKLYRDKKPEWEDRPLVIT